MNTAQRPTWQTGASSSPTASYELGDLLGVSGPSVLWGRLLAFFAAQVIVYWLSSLVPSLIEGHFVWSAEVWVSRLSSGLIVKVIFTAAVLGAFRWIRNSLLAAPLAAVAYSLVLLIPRLIYRLGPGSVEPWRLFVDMRLGGLISTAVALFGLAVAVRWMKPLWLAIFVGSTVSSLVAVAARNALSLALGGFSEITLRGVLIDVAYGLGGALVFAGIFWGGLQLPWARLREGPHAAIAHSGANYQRISKGFFLGSFGVAIAIAIPLVNWGNNLTKSEPRLALFMLAVSFLPILYCGVVMMVLFYKMWAAVQDGYARTTPGKAIGFMFIPFFNVYWAFQLVWGWAKDYNHLVERHRLDAPRLPQGLFLAYVILAFTGWIPMVGMLLVGVNYLVGLAMVEKTCDGINAIPPQVKPAAST